MPKKKTRTLPRAEPVISVEQFNLITGQLHEQVKWLKARLAEHAAYFDEVKKRERDVRERERYVRAMREQPFLAAADTFIQEDSRFDGIIIRTTDDEGVTLIPVGKTDPISGARPLSKIVKDIRAQFVKLAKQCNPKPSE